MISVSKNDWTTIRSGDSRKTGVMVDHCTITKKYYSFNIFCSYYLTDHLLVLHFSPLSLLCLSKHEPAPASFLFIFVLFNNNCRLQQDSNSDRRIEGKHADHLTNHKTLLLSFSLHLSYFFLPICLPLSLSIFLCLFIFSFFPSL